MRAPVTHVTDTAAVPRGSRTAARVFSRFVRVTVVLLFAWALTVLLSPTASWAAETEPPSVPTNVAATPGVASPNVANITWDASTDNVGVVGYRVWRSVSATAAAMLLGDTDLLSFMDVTGVPGQPYWYAVSAFDASGNDSGRSAAVGPVVAGWTQPPHAAYSVNGTVCKMCHAPHVAATPISLMRQTGTAPGEVSVCYSCHDGQGATTNISSGMSNSFALASGHVLEQVGPSGDLTDACSGCHGPHADYTTRPMLPKSEINGSSVGAAENAWCYACHNDSNDWYGAGYPSMSAPSRDASGYPVLGTFPGPTVYDDPAANPHASIDASAAAGRERGDCLYCHDSHRASNKYDALYAEFRPSTASTVATDQASGVYAASCFECHGGVGGRYFSTVPTGAVDIKQFVTAATTRAGHRIKTAGGLLPVGAPLPCYDCHNPHGSSRNNTSLISDHLGEDLETSTAAGVRAFCFTCHSSSDGMVWDSATATMTPVGADSIEGLRRDGTGGNVLRVPAVTGHDSSDTVSCYQCHGSSYASGGNNVHNPSGGVSQGGEPCYNCHTVYQDYMEDGTAPKVGSQRTTVYHHVLGGSLNGGAYEDGDYAPGPSGAYPTSGVTNVFCVVCHVDHDQFNSNQAANLRVQFPSYASNTATNTDFHPSLILSGLCTSCHGLPMPKDTVNQKSDGTNLAQRINSSQYNASAHEYEVRSSYGDSSQFRANCSKCHTDEQTKDFQTSSARFGTHFSAARRLVSAFGVSVTDPIGEDHCYGCHSEAGAFVGAKPVAGRDWYGAGGSPMSGLSEYVYDAIETMAGSQHPVKATAGGSVECENCHNPHNVTIATGTPTASRVSNPDNTLNLAAYGTATEQAVFCLRCHDGTAPVQASTPTTYVPSSVVLANAADNKSTNAARGHWSANGSISGGEIVQCGKCHDNHGSNYPKLLGEYDPNLGNRIAGQGITGNNNTVCAACHDTATTSYPAGEAQREAGTGYLLDGTWPGMSVYNTAYNGAAHTGNGHGSAGAVWPGKPYAAGDCKNCHDVHGTANTYDELRTEDAAGVQGTYGFDDVDLTVCFNCHDSDGPAATDIAAFYPASSGGSNGGSRAGHQVVSNVAGANLLQGQAVPCYDCHNPHGSASAYGLQVRDIGDAAGEIDVSSADGVRKFCFACHATSDTTEGWTGAAYAAVGTTAVEGFRRDGSDGSVLKLPAANGHRKADAQSCYQCHGNDATNNVHNPTGGLSAGGQDCYGCHATYQTYMEDGIGSRTGANRADTYHHVMGSAANEGDRAFGAGTYPTSTTDLFCLSCHVDHDKFNASMSGNLRPDIATVNPAGVATDYNSTSNTGVCTACHTNSLTKQVGTDQKDDGSTATPRVVPGGAANQFGASAHDYAATSAYSDATTFSANCSKCHNDEQTKDFQTSANKFGTHWSAARRILSALGGAVTDPLQENHCYRCHSRTTDALAGTKKTVALRDWYDATAMTAASERVWAQFQLASKHPVVASGGDSVECESCHNAHVVTATTGKVTDPDNTYNTLAYGTVAEQATYCLRCHDGTLPAYLVTGATYRPYSVTQANVGVNTKSTYAARAHWTANGSIAAGEVRSCAACHDNHGSSWPKLLGAYDMTDSRNEINGSPLTGNDNGVCYACHTNSSTSYPALEAQRQAGTGYLMDGTWPGGAVYSGANGIHDGASVIWPSSSYVGGDCKNCHDVHGTANTYDETVATFTNGDFTLCFTCHDVDGPATRNIKTYYPGSVGGAGGGSGHEIKTAGGNLPVGGVVPCYDCHNPHGSASAYGLQVRNIGDAAGEIDLGSAAGIRRFCFTCHATSDTNEGWNGSVWASVGTTTVEGLRRDGTGGSLLRLPAMTGHAFGDIQSCYQCHGNDYSGLSTNNVHNPSGGVSAGGQDCYGCHTSYQSYMEDDSGGKTGSNNATVYHHVLGGTVGSYYDGDKAFAAGSYPTASATEVFCLSCHVDHDKFNASMSGNLRPDLATANPGGVATDYNSTSNTGVCTACHTNSLTKQVGAEQKNDGSTATPKVVPGGAANQFGASAHDYAATSAYSDATTFSANCSKCHNDEQTKDFQTSANTFGTHWSAARRILSALGGAVTDPLQESHCYRCHSRTTDALAGTKKTVANRDWYDATAMTAASERVWTQFQLASKHPVVASGGNSVECESCHNAHVVTATTGKVTDPDNTYNTLAYGTAAEQSTYCMRCHDGTTPAYTVNGTTYIPYNVTIAAGDAALMNKSTFAARAHWTVNGSIGTAQQCALCHDNHGSAAPKLLGAYDMTDSRNEINGVQISANNNTVCTACHTAADAVYPSVTRAANGYPTDGRWPGNAVYTGAGGIHNVAGVVWPGSSYAAGDCKNCHDVHGTANTYDELRGTYSPTSFDNCFQCHDGAPSTKNIRQYYPTTNGGGATQTAADNFGHKIQTPGGTLAAGDGLPCYDCHNPHGNANSTDGLLVITQDNGVTIVIGDAAGEIDMSTSAGNRRFCFSCHTTADTTEGWNGTAYDVVNGTALIEGIDRKVYDSVNKRGLKLPPVSGHNVGDTTQSCYSCHGDSYASATSNNVHNPGPGGSNGGIDCLNCHGASAGMRLDRMVSDTGYYHHVLDYPAGSGGAGVAPNAGAYPNSTNSLACVSCHTDHNYFNSNKGSNLRTSISNTSGASNTNSDFIAGGAPSYGVCLSCHTAAQTKSTSQKTTNAGTQTLAMSATYYDVSAHDYNYAASFGGSTFNANCSKCHDDEQDALQTYQTSTYKIATHYSNEVRIARALGAALTASTTSTEENLCYRCHSGAGPNDGYGTRAMSAASRSIQTQFASTSAHNVASATWTGRHKADEYTGAPASINSGSPGGSGWWGTSNGSLHVECEDCHNPHAASSASLYKFPNGANADTANFNVSTASRGNTAVPISSALKGVWGVDITGSVSGLWAGSPTPPTYTKLAEASYEWQLCLKCHSTYAWGTNTPPTVDSGQKRSTGTTAPTTTRVAGVLTDVGQEFNPNNFAYHPLFKVGRNQPASNLNTRWTSSALRRTGVTYLSHTFVDGWLQTSIITCSDCHGNNSWTNSTADGVHGSSNPWILRGVNTGIKVTTAGSGVVSPNTGAPASNFCLNCHRADVYGYGTNAGPATADDLLSRVGHRGGATMRSQCNDGATANVTDYAPSGCFLCHGGRQNDNAQSLGATHGSNMGRGDGVATANNGQDAQNGTLIGNEMGKRFMNGVGWDAHTLGDVSGNVTCNTIDSANSYSDCTNHSGTAGRTGAPTYYYQWQ